MNVVAVVVASAIALGTLAYAYQTHIGIVVQCRTNSQLVNNDTRCTYTLGQ
jgi:hypothetical protein